MHYDWEQPQEATNLDYLDNPFIAPGGHSSRRFWAREKAYFRPENLEEADLRRGTDRRWMRGKNIYLTEELRLRNNLEGLLNFE
jgi:hypothetical protein